jgi:pimeloyl-ACP methyl ester carboxylesterase
MRDVGRPERFERDGCAVLDHRFGTGDDVPFVLVHGIGVGLSYFVRLAALLAEHGPVHVLELPGFGRTPKPSRVLSVEQHAALLVALLRTLDRPAVLVGQSMGCQVVLEAALQAPELVQRIVAIGPVVDPDERSAVLQGLRLVQDVLRETPGTNRAVFGEYLRCGPRRYLATMPSMLAYDTDAAAAAVRVPTMILRGAHDPICRRPWARRLTARLADGALIEVPGAHHNVNSTHPRAVASAVLSAPPQG